MKKYTLVSLSKPVDSKGLSVGDIGIIIECKPHDVFGVMFFNKNALGDYLVANLFRKDFREIPHSLSQDWIAQFENGIDDIERKDSFKQTIFKEYDKIMVVNEKSAYSKCGVHKGAIGVIMTDYSIDGKWYVIFSDKRGEDYADIEVSEKDMVIINP